MQSKFRDRYRKNPTAASKTDRKAYSAGRDESKVARLQAQLQDALSSTLGEAARVSTVGLMNDANFFEKDEYPACPRWKEICNFLVRNRSQDYLCLDTMPERFPEHTLWNHIRLFSADPKNIANGRAIDISPEDWRAFLFQCNLRWKAGNKDALIEYITSPPNHRQGGEIKWLKRDAPGYPTDRKPSTRVMRYTPTIISKNTMGLMAEFKAFVLLNDQWYSWLFSDMEFEDLLDEVNDLARLSGSSFRFTDKVLRIVIDFYERKMELFCWGPNGVVRRLVDTWPTNPPPPTPPRTPGSTLKDSLALQNQNYDKIGQLTPKTPTSVPKSLGPSSPDSKKSSSSSSSEEGGLTGNTAIFEGELYRPDRNTEPNTTDPKSTSPGSGNGSGDVGLTGKHTIFGGVVYGPESGSGPVKHFLDPTSEVGTRQGDWIGSESGSGEG